METDIQSLEFVMQADDMSSLQSLAIKTEVDCMTCSKSWGTITVESYRLPCESSI